MSKVFEKKIPWIEKYRPSSLDDIIGNEQTIKRLKSIANDKNMPHLLLSGPSGTGKTTSIYCLSKKILGDNLTNEGILELNASDERGIDVVRGKIKMFAQKKILLPNNAHKIIILDEADSMTCSAMQAMRRTMEQYAQTTRFVFVCNDSTKIIEPIQSRCSMIRYSKLEKEDISFQLKKISKNENIEIKEDGINAITFISDGDMRQSVNILQSCSSGFKVINEENIFYIADIPHPKKIENIIFNCIENKVNDSLNQIIKIYENGYSSSDIIGTLYKVCKNIDIPDEIKLNILKEIGFTQLRISSGLSTLPQLLGLVSSICEIN